MFLSVVGIGVRCEQYFRFNLAEPIDLIPLQHFRCDINFPVPDLLADADTRIYSAGFFPQREVLGHRGPDTFADNVGGARGRPPTVSSRDVVTIDVDRPQNDQPVHSGSHSGSHSD